MIFFSFEGNIPGCDIATANLYAVNKLKAKGLKNGLLVTEIFRVKD